MSPRTARRVVAAAATLAVGAALAAWATGPAHADISTIIGKASVSDSTPSKVAIITCPTETVVLGGGAEVYEGDHAVHVTGWMPVPPQPGLKYPNSMVGYGAESEDGYNGRWQVGVMAHCGPEPAGLEYVSAGSASTSPTSRSQAAHCPTDKLVVGTGARIATGDGQVYLTGVRIADDLGSVTADAHEDADGFAGNWSLHAYAICALPLPDHDLYVAETDSDSITAKEIQVACPVGTEPHGLGFALNGAAGHVHLRKVRVVDDWLGGRVEAIEAGPTLTDANWSARVYTVCASE